MKKVERWKKGSFDGRENAGEEQPLQGGAWTERHQEKTNSLAYDFARVTHAAGFPSHQGPSHLILAQRFEVVNSVPHVYPGRRDGAQTTQARGRAQTFLGPSLQSWPQARVGGRNCGRGLPVPTHPHGPPRTVPNTPARPPSHACTPSSSPAHSHSEHTLAGQL